jgi:hypothetical protein
LISLAMLVLEPPIDRLSLLIEYVRPVIGQVVVVMDDRTSQTTASAIKKLLWDEDDCLVPYRWANDFAAARNTALPECVGRWVLHLDPDELPSAAMLAFLGQVAQSETATWDAAGWLFWTVNLVDGSRQPGMESDWHCRLFQRDRGRWYRAVHELVELDRMEERETRNTAVLPKAPTAACLIHSKTTEQIALASELYARIGA